MSIDLNRAYFAFFFLFVIIVFNSLQTEFCPMLISKICYVRGDCIF